MQGKLEPARFLIGEGANVNAPRWEKKTPLHDAAISGNIALMKMLLAAGAAPGLKDATGNTPLRWAVIKDRKAAVECLERHAARPDPPEQTPQKQSQPPE